ncbi:MAG: radical SAM protein [Oscillospiraceae bacterium]
MRKETSCACIYTTEKDSAGNLCPCAPSASSKCQYCDFYSLGGSREKGLMEDYLEAVCLHIKEAGALAPGYQVDTVYFGGGTPSFLGADGLVQILNAIRRRFAVSADAEITFEANPDSVTEKLLKRLRAEGFNRISLGIQNDDDGLLKKLGRPHSCRQAVQASADSGSKGGVSQPLSGPDVRPAAGRA